MNKLIIVGNGFDLHHKVPTRYNDFLEWWLAKLIDEALTGSARESSLFNVHVSPLGTGVDVINTDSSFEISRRFIDDPKRFSDFHFKTASGMYKFGIAAESDLINELLTHHYDLKWIDVEATYYDVLKKYLRKMKALDRPREIIPDIRKLNEHLNILRSELKQYLWNVSENKRPYDSFAYKAKLPVRGDQIIDKNARRLLEETHKTTIKPQIEIDDVLFLNFNYTSLCRKLASVGFKFRYIDIHGNLKQSDDQLIFGYGDEIDESYIEMEKTNFNDFLTHIKSFGYSQNDNYSDLVRFINAAPFTVYIWGHSCGLSDRTLLNMIFEHDNCTLIQPFYWKDENGLDNYTEIVQNISRHFRDKQKMRNRVANKQFCEPL